MSNETPRIVAAAAAGLFVVVMLGVFLGGAGNAAPANGQVTLTWYVRDNAVERQWEDQVIQAFRPTHPTITVELVVAPSWEGFDLRLNGMWLQGNPPDVWSPHGANAFIDYYQKGWLADLTPFINGSSPLTLTDFFTDSIAMYTIDGKVHGLPILSGGSFLFYNKELFDAAGVSYPLTDWDDPTWTWDAMVSKAISLTQNPGDPDNAQYGVTTRLWPWDAYAWLWGQDLFPASAYQRASPANPSWTHPPPRWPTRRGRT